MNHDKTFIMQASEAARVMGCSSEDVARLGQVITPDATAGGKGYRAGYSFQNLVEMRIVLEMVKFGVPRKRIATYLTTLRKSRESWLEKEGWLVVDGEWQWQLASNFQAILLGWREPPGSFLAISIGKIKRELLSQKPIEGE